MHDPFSLNWLSSFPSISHHEASFGLVTLDYYMYGKNPRLFMSSGMHGDECGVISSVSNAIKKYLKNLPSFIFVSIASPSAVKGKTRNNAAGQNVNRGFLKDSTTDESKAIMNIVKSHIFDLSISFHEDLEYPTFFYLYDSLSKGKNKDITHSFIKFKEKLVKMKIGLFNGIDDPHDPALGFKFSDGYKAFPYIKSEKEDGSLETWLINNSVSSRCFTPEIPENYSQEIKDKIVEEFFTCLIIPFF